MMTVKEANEIQNEKVNEEWRDVVGYEGLYIVSNYAEVRCVSNDKSRKEKTMKTHVCRNGYVKVNLSKNNQSKKLYVHRVVGLAFLDNPHNKPQINHKNFNKQDNRLENLEFVTRQENIAHAYENGLIKRTNKPVVATNIKIGEQRQFKSQLEASKALGIYPKHISKVLNNGVNPVGDWKFERIGDSHE